MGLRRGRQGSVPVFRWETGAGERVERAGQRVWQIVERVEGEEKGVGEVRKLEVEVGLSYGHRDLGGEELSLLIGGVWGVEFDVGNMMVLFGGRVGSRSIVRLGGLS